MATDRRTANIDSDILQLIFQRIQEKVLRRSEDEKHAADRHQRRAVDALRSRIKHLDPPLRATDTWDQVRPRIEKFEEYKALESDELRQSAFEKVIRRLKEKEEEIEKDRDLRERDRGRRGDHLDRERDHRNGQPSRGERRLPSGRPSRTPEPDPYEADRRKAQADRERSYRKATGLSPIRDRRDDRDRLRDRDRDRERERDRDRRGPPHYDRERRDREEERERLYRTRGDPRGSRDELDYGGDARSTVSTDRRRRRDSDTESVASRSAKRARRDDRERGDRSRDLSRRDRDRDQDRDRRERTPAVVVVEAEAAAKKEEKAVHSGSEEGEIEED
jgi:pre-mRNA-processing factor 40